MKDLLKLAVCWIAFALSLVAGGAIGQILHLHVGAMPGGVTAESMFAAQLAAGVVLVVGLYPLARGLAARGIVRVGVVAGFLLLALGLNGVIEARCFTHFLDQGAGAAIVFDVSLAAILGMAVGLCFGSAGEPFRLARRTWSAWMVRAGAVWIGWPLIYFLFGMCIAPIVTPYYRAGIAGLRIPSSVLTIFGIQMIRSVVFLASSLPLVALWKGSRRGLWLTLGLAHACTVGLYEIAGATYLPTILRVVHSVEMTCDAFAYAGLLVLLFTAPGARTSANAMAERQMGKLSAQGTR